LVLLLINGLLTRVELLQASELVTILFQIKEKIQFTGITLPFLAALQSSACSLFLVSELLGW
jgi:hypothetical protein